MKNMTFTTVLLCILFMPFFISSCTDKIDEHYEEPEWLKGSAWEVLEDRGNYSLFLQAVELAGFKPIMEGKSILTVMAPDDTAFSAYLEKHGYSDISEINLDELKKVIGFHLLYYSYNKNKLVNFRPEGDLITDEEMNKNAGLYYKFRTRSSNVPTMEVEASIIWTVLFRFSLTVFGIQKNWMQHLIIPIFILIPHGKGQGDSMFPMLLLVNMKFWQIMVMYILLIR